jgi:hypothetical protein
MMLRKVYALLVGNARGSGGESLPVSRLDRYLAMVLGVALIVATVYSMDALWSWKSAAVFVAVVLATTIPAHDRLAVVGGALAVVAARFVVSAFLSPHNPVPFILGALASGLPAWLCLKHLD